MKRNTKPFSIEIKKSRIPGQLHHLPPRSLFVPIPVEPSKIVQKEEPQAAAETSPVPRILPSIVEHPWGNSEPADPVRREDPAAEARREQMEFDLTTSAFEDVKATQSDVPVITEAVPQVDMATEPEALSAHDGQPVQVAIANARARKPTRKASAVVEPLEYPQRAFDLEQPPEAELTLPSAPKAVKRRLTKRQAATIQLPRHERWKRRLHPAIW
ncbi:hypothetical protein [Microvirga sesbaniae]|uniref:hypothetical protein n=1 Tax=Microvirga sesbaniae TaxID=681392 RepID=UPI0021C5766C|nr:hypothetical protein [Microvirga sp. HBU67692]